LFSSVLFSIILIYINMCPISILYIQTNDQYIRNIYIIYLYYVDNKLYILYFEGITFLSFFYELKLLTKKFFFVKIFFKSQLQAGIWLYEPLFDCRIRSFLWKKIHRVWAFKVRCLLNYLIIASQINTIFIFVLE